MNTQNNKGFTLVEMAIVLVVIGLLVGMGAGLIGPLTTMSKVRESREVVESDITSIISWAASNNRLPDATTNTATYFTNTLKSVNDTWGNPVYYLYSCPFGEGASSAYCTDASSFSKDTICGRKTTSLRIITPTATIQNVAFVLMSDMYDSVQTTLDGNLTTLIGGTITTTAIPDTVITRSGAVSPRVGTLATITLDANNSDIVRWVTLDELRSKIGCQGAQLKIVNNELPYAFISNTYNANITADGGAPYTSAGGKYRWCIQGTAPTLPTKPIIKSSDGSTDIVYNVDCINLSENSWIRGDYISLNLSVVVASTKAYTCKTASSVTPPTPEWSEVGVNWTTTTNYSPSTTVVSGTNAYTCKQPHTSSAVNQPQIGANWRDYWTLTGEQWVTGSYTPPTSTYNFTVFVRDNNDNDPNTPIPPTSGKGDNIASKAFVLTINP